MSTRAVRRSVVASFVTTSLVMASMSLSACGGTEIIGSLDTTTTVVSTSTDAPSGDILTLLDDLVTQTDGLGQAIVDGKGSVTSARLDRTEKIWALLEPQIRQEGIDIVEQTQTVVDLVRTAVKRKRPADADKAQRFAGLLRDSVASAQ